MKSKLTFKDAVLPALILVIICAVSSAALAGTNMITKDKIAEAALETAANSRMIVLPEADSFTETDAGYYEALSGDEVIGYIFETTAKGYGGDVDVMTGITTDGNISGVAILSQNETPGLGANVLKEDFTSQYQQAVPEHGLHVVKGQAGEGDVEALTGATISTNAVTNAVNEAVSIYNETIKGASE